MSVDWAALVFSEAYFERVSLIARKKFVLDAAASEEAVTFVITSLAADEWKRCQSFKGKSAPETFLYSLATSLVNDYFRKIYGRPRPPVWLQRKGDLWVTFWKELCLYKKSVQEVIDRHTQTGRDGSILQEIVRGIKSKLPWCGVSDAPLSLDDPDQTGAGMLPGDVSAEVYEERERQADALSFASLLLAGAESAVAGDATDVSEEISLNSEACEKIKALDLSPEEQILLKMVYCDALSHTAVAQRLGVSKAVVVRQIKATLNRIRECLDV